MEQFEIKSTLSENKMEKYYSGFIKISLIQLKNCCPIYDDEDSDPFDPDPMNINNWDVVQQVGFRD